MKKLFVIFLACALAGVSPAKAETPIPKLSLVHDRANGVIYVNWVSAGERWRYWLEVYNVNTRKWDSVGWYDPVPAGGKMQAVATYRDTLGRLIFKGGYARIRVQDLHD